MKTIEEYNKIYGWKIPTVCPACNGKVEINQSGFPICANPFCIRKTSHRFRKMFKILSIRGTGEAFIKNLESEDISISYFLSMCKKNNSVYMEKLAGGINGKKIITQMKKAMEEPISVHKYLAMFDYKGFDEKKLKYLPNSFDFFYNLKKEELVKFDGFAETTANLLIEFIDYFKEEIEDLRKFFTIVEGEKEKKNGKFTGISFCFTGSAALPRSELQRMVEDNGGVNKNSVAKGLSYLVTDDTASGSAKNTKAKQLGIPVISSLEFIKMVKE